MSTFVGHALAAILAASTVHDLEVRRRRLLVFFAVVVALLPDLDIVIFLALKPLGMVPHRGFSHTVLFAIASSGLVTLLASRVVRLPTSRVWLVLFLAALSHPVLDYLMGAGPEVPFFAPIQDRGYLLPFRLLPIAYYGKAAGVYVSMPFWILNATAAGLEALIFLPAIIAVDQRSSTLTKVFASVLVLLGLLLTVKLYN